MLCSSAKHIGPILLVYTILFFHIPHLQAQQDQYLVETIPLKGEMANFSGSCFLQDSEGFMWFGSKDGLYRYSGNGLKVYRNDPNTTGSLNSSNIYSLFEDSRGVMWVGTRTGLHSYDENTETFRYFEPRGDSSGPGWGHTYLITEDEEGVIWFTSLYGFTSYHWESDSFRNYSIASPNEPLGNKHQVFGIYSDGRGFLWLNTMNGLFRFEKATGSLERIEGHPWFTWSIYEDLSGRRWLICDHGLYLFDIQDQSFERYLDDPGDPNHLRDENIRAMTEDHEGNIWIRTLEGLYCYNQDLEKQYYLKHKQAYPYTYDMEEITQNLYVDRSGSLWYYTPDGINQITSRDRNFNVYDSDELISGLVNCIHTESKDRIWYGSPLGICCFDRGTNSHHLYYGGGWDSDQRSSTESMYLDRQGTLWISLWNKGIYSMQSSPEPDGKGRSLDPGTIAAQEIKNEKLYQSQHLFEDSSGRLWVGMWSEGPLRYLDRVKNMMVHLVDNPDSDEKFPPQAIVMQETSSGRLWAFGTYGAIQIIPPFTRISDSELMPTNVIKIEGIPPVACSYLDSSSTLWLGTDKRGLIRYSRQNIITYTEAQGLAGNQVKSILPDENGNLWIGTYNGLSKFNTSSGTFTNFYKRHGLPINQFQSGSAATGEDGELFFGTRRGMFSLFPDSISINLNVPPVKLTGFRIHNLPVKPGEGSVLTRSISKTEKIELKHNQDHLSFEFAILNYRDPELNQYKYMLEGLDHDWIYSGTRNFAIYSNLDPGKYTFMVKGANNDGIWNEEAVTLQIAILPPPWQTWYAYLVYGLIVAGVLLWYRRYQQNRAKLQMAVEVQKMEKEKIQEIDRMKSLFFANISHEFRTPLTLILGPLDEAKKKKSGNISFKSDVVAAMRRNASRLLLLINQLLEVTKIESGKMKLQVSKGDFEGFVRTLVLSFLSLAESKGIKYTYDLSQASRSFYFDPDKLEKILTNLMSNAFKFTPEGGMVDVRLDYVKADTVTSNASGPAEFAEIKVSDTGKGIPADKLDRIFDRFYQEYDSDTREDEGTGIGLALTRELVDLYRGELEVESEVGRGSLFTVRLPVSRQQFNEEEIMVQEEESVNQLISGGRDLQEKVSTETKSRKVRIHRGDEPSVLIVEDNTDLINYISGILGEPTRFLSQKTEKWDFKKPLTASRI